jgi:hypothetical protein
MFRSGRQCDICCDLKLRTIQCISAVRWVFEIALGLLGFSSWAAFGWDSEGDDSTPQYGNGIHLLQLLHRHCCCCFRNKAEWNLWKLRQSLVGMQALSNTKCTQNTQIWKSPTCVGYFQPVCSNCHPGPVLFFRQTRIFRQRALIALIAEEYFRVNLF